MLSSIRQRSKSEHKQPDDNIGFSFPFPFGMVVGVCQFLERLDQYGPGNAELLQAFFYRPCQNALALSCQPHQNARAKAQAPYQIIGLCTIYKFDCAVVMPSELLRECTNARFHALWKTSYGKEQLILPRFDTGRPGCLIAEIQIAVDMMSKFRQCPVIGIFSSPLGPVCLNGHGLKWYRDTIFDEWQTIFAIKKRVCHTSYRDAMSKVESHQNEEVQTGS